VTDVEVKAAMSDRTALALTMYAEARGDKRQGLSSVEERIAVGCVVRNRVRDFARFRAEKATYASVVLAPKQFSCWDVAGGPANHALVMAFAERLVQGLPMRDVLLAETLYLADGIIAGVLLDCTGGATAYFAPKAMVPVGRVPTWAEGKTTRAIGDQLFLTV
jgi:hypothetical protein